jgi:hypothetical protein
MSSSKPAFEVEPLFDAGLCVWLDGVHRAFRLAHTAVDALVGVNDEHVLALVEAVHGAHLHAVRVLATNAVLVDDVGQLGLRRRIEVQTGASLAAVELAALRISVL